MGDVHHFSQIRIGNRVVYNGVNGDAFAFGENPAISSNISSNEKEQPTSNSKTANGVDIVSTDVSAKYSNVTLRVTGANTAHVTKTSDPDFKIDDYHDRRPSSAQISATAVVSSVRQKNEQLRLQLRSLPTSPVSLVTTSPLQQLSVNIAGLPPILPPPPAAHLPPPLPSRPPSALPSPASSISSLHSFRYDDRSLPSPPSSPNDSLEVMTSNNDNSPHNPYGIRNFFFRSSGTIKVEAPSRDLQHSPPHPPLSPPPLPLPVPLSSTLPSPLTPHSTVPTSITGTRPSSKHSDLHEPAKTTTTTSTIVQLPTSSQQNCTASSTSLHIDSEEEDEDLVDNNDNTSGANGGVPPHVAEFANVEQTRELVLTRDGDKLYTKNKPRLKSQSSDAGRKLIPPEFENIRNQSMTYADVISKVLMFYKLSKGAKKKIPYVQPKLEKASHCRKCGRQFGLRYFRYHCSRCKKSFCDDCIPVMRVDSIEQDLGSSLTRVCLVCSEEIAFETCRGTYRGLWSEFKTMRDEKRAQRGLDVTSSKIHKSLESQSMLDVTPGLMNLCMRFLVDVHRQLEKQQRHKFLANYLQFENSTQSRQKSKIAKIKECHACKRQLRMLTDIRDCSICEQTFCMNCTYMTLQLYLPKGTDLKGEIHIESIKFHVKSTEQDDVESIEIKETYRLCADCEDELLINLRIHEFNHKIPDVEAEMFDLQRQIDHALTYGIHLYGMKRSVSANNLYQMSEHESMATNIKLANQLYGRYMRAYDNLEHMMPQSIGQKKLHKHIKQAMYDFYLQRRSQLKSTLRRRDSWANISIDLP